MSEQTALLSQRNFPDSEETEYVVYSEEVEIFGHLLHPRLPPGIAVLGHFVPVVGREAPVLTVSRESIRRCTCAGVHIEKMRILPGIHAGAGNAYRQVALEHNSLFAGIGTDFLHLGIKMILDIAPEIHIVGIDLAAFLQNFIRINGILAPFCKFSCTEGISQGAESRIRTEPTKIVDVKTAICNSI